VIVTLPPVLPGPNKKEVPWWFLLRISALTNEEPGGAVLGDFCNDLCFSQLLGFLGDWSLGWKVNNSRIAVGGLGYGDTWEWNGERGGASQFSGGPAGR
jgi:hypothetical protein